MLSSSSNKQEDRPVPTTQDFDPGVASRKVQVGIPQRPETIIPLAFAAVFGMIALAFSSPWAVIGSIAFSAIGVLSWAFNVSYRSTKLVEEYYEKLQENLNLHREQEVEDVMSECRRANFHEGNSAAEQIQSAYVDLQNFLQDKVGNNFQMQEFLDLGRKCLEQGVNTIRRAMGIHIALRDVNTSQMQDEIRDWQKKIKRLKKGEDQSAVQALKQRIATNEGFLELCDKRNQDLHLLIAECEEIENALKTAQLESAMLSVGSSESFLESNAAKTLQNRIESAVRVEERLQGRMGGTSPEQEQTEEYLLNLSNEE